MNPTSDSKFHLSTLSLALAFSLGVAGAPRAQGIAAFDSSFLHRMDGQESVDLSIFAMSDRVLPGTKSVMLMLNRRPVGMREMEFAAVPGKADAQPCVTQQLLGDVGVNVRAFPKLQELQAAACGDTLKSIPMASVAYDQSNNVVNLSIPQAALDRRARGQVPQERWDNGETAFWSSYRLSYNQGRFSGENGSTRNHSTFASFRNGLNIGEWRLRGNVNYYESDDSSSWDWSELYAERSINAWRSWLRLGDSVTPGNIFNAARIRGVQLQSDNGMLPDSQQGYAPVVRGVAPSSAKVTVRQGGRVLYSAFVPAGPFEFDDLYSTPGGGDLEVEVEELDGKVTRYFQPYAALPTMMREGVWDYSAAFGEYRRSYYSESPWMGQATFAYGLPWNLTAYGGLSIAQQAYQAGAIGMALNMQVLGAISMDVTTSRSQGSDGQRRSGAAARIQYAKSFPGSGTDFTLAGYRYNSDGYRSLDDTLRERERDFDNRIANLARMHEYQLSMSQRIGTIGSLSLNYYSIAYRNAPRSATYSQIAYSSSVGRVGYSLNYGLSRSPWGRDDHSVMLTLSIPLGGSHSASYTMNRTNNQGTSHDVNLSGALLDDYSLTYAVQTGVTTGSEWNNGGHGFASLGYSSPIGVANVSQSYARNSSNTSLDFSGAVYLDGKGPLLGQSIGETAIVVDAPGAGGVVVENFPGVRTNEQGRALIPYARPYRENRVSLKVDPDKQDATLEQNVQTVVPTRGAVVVAQFATELGRSVLVVLRDAKNVELPFGAAVFGSDGQQRGIVGPVGRVWLTGIKGESQYAVKWGEEKHCTFTIDAAAIDGKTGEVQKDLTCE